MIQEFVSPTKNHVFELNNKIKVLDNKIDNLTKDITKSNTEFENFKSKLPIIIANGGHDYVEIAGIKWATMNIGAQSITDPGLYFQWGDIQGYTADQVGTEEGKKKFARDLSDYKYTSTFTKYNTSDKKKKLDLEDDVVHAAWGGSWRMPIYLDIDILIEAIKSSAVIANWTSNYNGTSIAGYEFHDKISNDTMFLPACGCASNGVINGMGIGGYYWGNALNMGNNHNANGFIFYDNDVSAEVNPRYYGCSVRGVLDVK